MWFHDSRSQTKWHKSMNLAESLLESLGEKENPMLLNWFIRTKEIATWAFLEGKACRPGLVFARIFDKLNIYEDMSHKYLLWQK